MTVRMSALRVGLALPPGKFLVLISVSGSVTPVLVSLGKLSVKSESEKEKKLWCWYQQQNYLQNGMRMNQIQVFKNLETNSVTCIICGHPTYYSSNAVVRDSNPSRVMNFDKV
jgi:hypothetical protein